MEDHGDSSTVGIPVLAGTQFTKLHKNTNFYDKMKVVFDGPQLQQFADKILADFIAAMQREDIINKDQAEDAKKIHVMIMPAQFQSATRIEVEIPGRFGSMPGEVFVTTVKTV